MLRRALSLALPFGASLLLAQDVAPPRASQEELPTFPGQVEQVTVDVVVTDNKGVPLKGLGKEDLEVLEDGVRQTVVSFEAVEVPPEPSSIPKPRPKISSNQGSENSRGRTFVVLFDDIHITPAMALRAKGAISDFLTRFVREGDRVTLAATLGGAWWSTRMEAGRDDLMALLKAFDGRSTPDTSRERMTDYEALRIHMMKDLDVADRVKRRYERFGVNQQGTQEPQQGRYVSSIDPYVAARAADVYFRGTRNNRLTLHVLERSLEALNATKGRKSLILVSEGFIYDPNLQDFKGVVQAARRANTAIYFVNPRGLEGVSAYASAQFGEPLPERDIGFALTEDFEAALGAESVASDSGGFTIRDTNDLSGSLRRIADENSAYYLVGYNPTNTARDGRFRKISVKLSGKKGLEVRARKGYYAPSDAEGASRPKRGVDSVFQEALDSPYELGDIPLRMAHFVGDETLLGKAQVRVAAEVDLGAVDLAERDGRYVGGVEFLLVAARRDTGEYSRYDQKAELNLLPATREKLLTTWFPILREFELEPGTYQAKIAVRDMRSGRVGTVVHEFVVPTTTEFRVSTPVLTDTRQEEVGVSLGEAVPVARREFEQGKSLFCQFAVYGAQKDGSGTPRVAMGYVVRQADGRIVTHVDPVLIRPTSLGELTRLIRLDLQGAQPGDYELVMALSDMVAGKMLEVREPFSVLAQGAPEQAATRARR